MNVAEYVLFTGICYWIASPPERLARLVNSYMADSRLVSYLPNIIRRALTVKRMPKELVIAVCFCGAAKTTSVGIPLTGAMWSQLDNFTIASIQVPVLLYTVEQVFVAQFFTIFFEWWISRDKKGEPDTESTTSREQRLAVDGQEDGIVQGNQDRKGDRDEDKGGQVSTDLRNANMSIEKNV